MTLREQLAAAFEHSGLSLVDLRKKSGLDITTVSLSRKLRGKQTLRDDEIGALAAALDISVSTPPPTLRKRRRAEHAA